MLGLGCREYQTTREHAGKSRPHPSRKRDIGVLGCWGVGVLGLVENQGVMGSRVWYIRVLGVLGC